MKRKEFIGKSFLALGALSMGPALINSLDPKILSGVMKINLHNRHGYFNNESWLNQIPVQGIKSICFDQFDNPEGNMLLTRLNLDKHWVNIALFEKEAYINDKAIQLTEETLDLSLDVNSKEIENDLELHTAIKQGFISFYRESDDSFRSEFYAENTPENSGRPPLLRLHIVG